MEVRKEFNQFSINNEGGDETLKQNINLQQPLLQEQVQLEMLDQKKSDHHMTAAYKNFEYRLCKKYLITEDIENTEELEKDLKLIKGNYDKWKWEQTAVAAYLLAPILCISLIWYKTRCIFEVRKNHFAMVSNWNGKKKRTELYGPGFHKLQRYQALQGIYSFADKQPLISSNLGDVQIATVEQGTIMHLELGGQNLILGPGIHKLTDPCVFIKTITLDSFYIEIGPEKFVTIPTGYDGISVNLGKIQILEGGQQYHLAHVGDKFVKLVPKFLQTDRLVTDIPKYVSNLISGKKQVRNFELTDPSEYLHTVTAEGSAVTLDAMVFWKITDTYKAAVNGMEILVVSEQHQKSLDNYQYHIEQASHNINDLRSLVLRQIKLYLTQQIGKCSLASASLMQNIHKEKQQNLQEQMEQFIPEDMKNERDALAKLQMSDAEKIKSFDLLQVLEGKHSVLVEEINQNLVNLGIHVEDLCIFSIEADQYIMQELNKQTQTKVNSHTSLIEAQAQRIKTEIDVETYNQKKIAESKIDGEIQKIKTQALAVAQKINAEGESQSAIAQAQTLKIQAQAQSEALKVKSQGEAEAAKFQAESIQTKAEAKSYAMKVTAHGEADAITLVSKSRKFEAEQLKSNKIAEKFASMRAAGDAALKVMNQKGNQFVFGNNPGDVLFTMFNKAEQQFQNVN